MKQIDKLDSGKVLKQIYLYRQQLEKAIQSGGHFGQLHSNIIRLFKIVYSKKSEYNGVVRYPVPPDISFISYCDLNGKEFERTSTYSEQELSRSRSELAKRLQAMLVELYEEYLQRRKLEQVTIHDCRTDIKNIKKELRNVNNELLKLRKEIQAFKAAIDASR
jgi:hypothetical protein